MCHSTDHFNVKYHETALCVLGFYQVVTDMRLWLRDAISTLADDAVQLLSTMVERAAV